MIPWLLAGCIRDLPEDQACREVGYAVASRVFECTGEAEASQDAFDAFDAAWRCAPLEPASDPPGAVVAPDGTVVRAEDLFACAAGIRALDCELVAQIEAPDDWLLVSSTCELLLEPAGGGR